jgi:hypothetical protein
METVVKGGWYNGVAAFASLALRGDSSLGDECRHSVRRSVLPSPWCHTTCSSFNKHPQQLSEALRRQSSFEAFTSPESNSLAWSINGRLKLRQCQLYAVQDKGDSWGLSDGLGANVEMQAELEKVMQEGEAPMLMEKLQTAEDRVLRAEVGWLADSGNMLE